ncbi:slit homolog 3 protein-like [Lytechinus pictus]|uniref:slit homolog 3 protein-like n=1 Tax=Lytechinus pictus TaxID=7653 RepID=UPI0030B9E3B8
MAHYLLLLHLAIILIQCSQSLAAQVNLGPRRCHEDLKEKTAMCGKMGFNSVPQHLPDGIEVLQLEYNNISSLLNSSFTRYPLIAKLDLSSNDLRVIETAAFHPLNNLTRLILCGNLNLLLQGTGIFKYTKKLSYFDMSDSLLGSIPYDMLAWSPSVDTLNLESNLLTFINMSLCGRAKTVDLTDNKIIRLTSNTFNFSCNTDTLNLSWNPIRSVDPKVIASLHVKSLRFQTDVMTTQTLHLLEHLEMMNADFFNDDLWDQGMNTSLFDGMFNLKTLDLSKSHLSNLHGGDNLPPEVLRQLSVLQNLSLEDCDLSDLHPEAFSGLKSLQVLILRNNNLEKLSAVLFKQLLNITIIDLSDNLLTDLDRGIFSSNRGLKTLLLSNNKLRHLDQSAFKPIKTSLLSIDISTNPINCNCDLSWLMDWLSGSLILQNTNKTICASDSFEPLQGQHLIEFDPKEFCNIDIVLICLPSLAIICLILIIGLMYHNRWQLRYKLFLVKLAAIGYKEMRDARDHNDYEFDLNVIFYDDDEDWTRGHLRPAVAERLPQFQRNVFGDDELVLGMYYLDAVDYVVSHSYKTVVILSRAAVRDRWFILKFRTAMDHVSDTRTEFVVVVFREDIPDDEMPFLVRLFLSDGRPYIYWTEDVRGQEYFFEELTKHLTINLRTNDRLPVE